MGCGGSKVSAAEVEAVDGNENLENGIKSRVSISTICFLSNN